MKNLPKIDDGSNKFGPGHPLPELEANPRLYSSENILEQLYKHD